jgi:two-component system KDP operon response regulator KdpE
MSNEIRNKILIVEDDPGICTFLRAVLTSDGYDSIVVGTGSLALDMIASHCPDCILLDLGLPDRDGKDVICRVREESSIPIIVLSARSDEKEQVLSLDMGANDYVTKPFGAAELMARVRSELRAGRKGPEETRLPGGRFVTGDLSIDYDARQVTIGESEIRFTQIEYNIVALLSQHCGRVLTYATIIREIWGQSDAGSVKKLQVNMANIRRKLGERPGDNRYIANELGVGYRMCRL